MEKIYGLFFVKVLGYIHRHGTGSIKGISHRVRPVVKKYAVWNGFHKNEKEKKI